MLKPALILALITTVTFADEPETKKALVDDVLDKAVQAIGGKEAIEKVKSLKFHGSISIPAAGIKGDFTSIQVGNKRFKITASVPGMGSEVTVIDGDIGWKKSIQGTLLLTDAQIGQNARQAAISLDPSKLKSLYDKVEYAGEVSYKGKTAHKILGKVKGAKPETFYFDTESGLPHGMSMNAITEMGEMKTEVKFTDFRSVGGVLISHESVIEMAMMPGGMKWTYTKAEVNPEIEEAEFEPPADVKKMIELKKKRKKPAPESQPAGK